jgi:hypothetical protein
MPADPGRPPAGQAAGVVKVRLSGDLPALAALAALLASHPAADILTGPDGPYLNRREPGSWHRPPPPGYPAPGRPRIGRRLSPRSTP